MSSGESKFFPPEGYALHQSYPSGNNGPRVLVSLFVPSAVKEAIDLQQKQDHARRLAEQEEQERRDQVQQRVARLLDNESRSSSSSLNSSGTTTEAGEESLDTEVESESYDPRQAYPVYPADAPSRLLARAKQSGPDKDLRKRDEEIAKRLSESGFLRRMAAPDNALATLAALRTSLPHFGAVIDLVRDHLLLAARSPKGARLPPLLLNGEPGLGKTHFAFELAKALGASVRRIAFDSPITGATLMGSERRWSNTQYGVLFELVCLGEHANPIVILDEIDKAEARREWDPLAPLHTLLEPCTATRVRDISLDFEFDVSRVTWIATSNHSHRMADSLRSRFREFQIDRPDAEAAIGSAVSVVNAAFAELALADFEPPGKAIAVCLAHLTAREVQQATEQAMARAVAQGRNHVTAEDLPAAVREEHGSASAPKAKTTLH